jgi:adenylate cyclase
VREVATGGSMLDPAIVEALVHPVRESDLSAADDELLHFIAEGRPIKAIAAARGLTPAAASDEVEQLFLRLARQASAGAESSLRRLRLLHEAIVTREEQGESLSRLLPGGLAEKLRTEGRKIGETERLDVTVLMSDIRGYSTIAEHTDPTVLAGQLNEHRACMNHAIIDSGGTVMQFVGDAVMAVFGAPIPQPDHADRAVVAASAMHLRQDDVNATWVSRGLEPFRLGVGLSTGEVAAALLGSEERIEYSLVGDTVNMAQRLQQWAEAGQTVISKGTRLSLTTMPAMEALEPALVKGRKSPVEAWRLAADLAFAEPLGTGRP